MNPGVETGRRRCAWEASAHGIPGGCFLVPHGFWEELWEPPNETQSWPAGSSQSGWGDTLSQGF